MSSPLIAPPHEPLEMAPGLQHQQLVAGISTTAESILLDSFGDMRDATTTATTATVTCPRQDEEEGDELDPSFAFDASDSPRNGTTSGRGTRRSKRVASRSNVNTPQESESFGGVKSSTPGRPESTPQGARPKRAGAVPVPLLEVATPCCASRPATRQPQPSLSSRSEGLYGRSPNSCNRHLRRSCRDREIEEDAAPKVVVDRRGGGGGGGAGPGR